jgi:NADPH:quinone reductase-like Zn-dependent oxidoreductase
MSTMKAVRIHEYGGPEVLQYEDAPRPTPPAPVSCSSRFEQ